MPAPSLPEDDLHLSLDISASTCPTSAPASLLPPIQTLPDPASQPPTAGVQTLELAFPFLYLSPADAANSVSSAFKHVRFLIFLTSRLPAQSSPCLSPVSYWPTQPQAEQFLTMGPKWTSPLLPSPQALHLPSLCLFPKSSSSRSHTSLPLVWDQNTRLKWDLPWPLHSKWTAASPCSLIFSQSTFYHLASHTFYSLMVLLPVFLHLNRSCAWESPNSTCVCLLSCFTHVQLCDPMDCSPPGSSVHGILQARILEWVAISFSRGSSWPSDQTLVSYVACTGRWVLYH